MYHNCYYDCKSDLTFFGFKDEIENRWIWSNTLLTLLLTGRGPSGGNFLAHVAINNPYLKYLKLFTKDELKMMLVEQ